MLSLSALVESQESYRQVMKMRPKDLWKRLMIKFRGEEGLDYGGVARYCVVTCLYMSEKACAVLV